MSFQISDVGRYVEWAWPGRRTRLYATVTMQITKALFAEPGTTIYVTTATKTSTDAEFRRALRTIRKARWWWRSVRARKHPNARRRPKRNRRGK